MTEYPTYETEGGQASEAVTYSRLCEHLRYAAEACYVLGHLRKANGDELIGTGFIGVGQMLEKVVHQVTKLATGSKMKWN
jgi:hypothetical protein